MVPRANPMLSSATLDRQQLKPRPVHNSPSVSKREPTGLNRWPRLSNCMGQHFGAALEQKVNLAAKYFQKRWASKEGLSSLSLRQILLVGCFLQQGDVLGILINSLFEQTQAVLDSVGTCSEICTPNAQSS